MKKEKGKPRKKPSNFVRPPVNENFYDDKSLFDEHGKLKPMTHILKKQPSQD